MTAETASLDPLTAHVEALEEEYEKIQTLLGRQLGTIEGTRNDLLAAIEQMKEGHAHAMAAFRREMRQRRVEPESSKSSSTTKNDRTGSLRTSAEALDRLEGQPKTEAASFFPGGPPVVAVADIAAADRGGAGQGQPQGRSKQGEKTAGDKESTSSGGPPVKPGLTPGSSSGGGGGVKGPR